MATSGTTRSSRTGRAALAALDRLDELTADLLLPGHGEPFAGGIQAATGQARLFGAH